MSNYDVSRVRRHFDEYSGEYVDKYFDSAVVLYQKKQCFLKHSAQYDPNQSLRVLDVGSGSGIWGDLFLDDYPWAQLVCLDLSLAMLRKGHPRPGKHLVVGNAINPPFASNTRFDLINLDAFLHHLIDYEGYDATIFGITQFLRSLQQFIKPGGKVLVREIYHESTIRDDIMSRFLFFVSTLNLPRFLASLLIALGIRSQGAGVCFLTRKQWISIVTRSGYRIIGRQELYWKQPFVRRLAGLRSSGDLFLLLSPQ